MAFPLFRGGSISGMVVLLGSGARPCETTELAALAIMSSLLGRVIEAHELAAQLQTSCRALDAELKAAADVQRWLLPPLTPSSQKAGIAASYITARRSGGDYYDSGELPDGRIGVLIADVSGKGAAAAVLMAVLRTIIHDEVDRAKLGGPAALLDYADARLCALGLPGRGAFVTAVSGILDTNTGVFTYSSAGHPPPRWLRARDRSINPLDGANTVPLGLLEPRSVHTEESVVLDVGDLVLLYTDGITEARSPAGEFFGIDGVDRVLSGVPRPAMPDQVIGQVSRAVSRFAGDDTPADDQTLLALARRATPAI
jgi:sigma-B regulation protein RsbU (phosphoserine phosphatase)